MATRYNWLKLMSDFFQSKRIKKMRKLSGGSDMLIIYLKMQLEAIKHGGYILYSGIEDTLAGEIALDLDEDEELVARTLEYLIRNSLVELTEDGSCYMPYAVENTGSESASAERVRRYRERKESECNGECNADVTDVKRNCNGELELEEELKEKEISKEKEKSASASKRFVKPSVDDIRAYAIERGSNVDVQRFHDYYEANGWKVGKNPMKDWKAAFRYWETHSGTGSPGKTRAPTAFNDFHQRTYDYGALEAALINR